VEWCVKEIVDHALTDMDARPDARLRRVTFEEALRDALLIEDGGSVIRLVSHGNRLLIALDAIEFEPDPCLAPLGGEHPRPIGKRRIVSCVAPVAAREFSDPLRLGIFMKRDDPAIQEIVQTVS
jgi:hypothetical protein